MDATNITTIMDTTIATIARTASITSVTSVTSVASVATTHDPLSSRRGRGCRSLLVALLVALTAGLPAPEPAIAREVGPAAEHLVPTGDVQVDSARRLMAQGQPLAALKALEDVGKARTGRAASLLGTLLMDAHRPQDARRALLEACSKTPTDAYAHGMLASAYFALGQDEDALHEASRARDLDPARPDSLWLIGTIDARMHRYADLVVVSAELARRLPKDPIAPFRAALGEAGQGHFREALVWARRAVVVGPAQPRPLFLLSRIEERLGMKDAAKEHLDAAAKVGLSAADLMEAQLDRAVPVWGGGGGSR